MIVSPILQIGLRKVILCPKAFFWDLAPWSPQNVLNHSALLSLEDVDASDRMHHAQKSLALAECHLTCMISFNPCNNPMSQVLLLYLSSR